MKPKHWIIAAIVTLGTIPLLIYAFRKVTVINVPNVSNEWIAAAEYAREGFQE